MNPFVKYKPDEFKVVENLVLAIDFKSDCQPRFSYLRVRKCGYTTFQIVAALARHLSIPASKISYAGLKDEDGITEQTVAVAGQVDKDAITLFNYEFATASDRFIELTEYGTGDDPIEIGKLNGNGFRMVVRNLDSTVVESLVSKGRIEAYFLNYYDLQRFGVPTGPRTTHLIGKALIESDFELALNYLRSSNSAESSNARTHAGNATKFFEGLDPRTVNFYRSSYASSEWNAQMAGLLNEHFPEGCRNVVIEGLQFSFLNCQRDLLSFASACRRLQYRKYYGDQQVGYRSTVIQTQIVCHSIEPDEVNSGRARCELSFFLPSGCYATMCVKQIFEFSDL